MTNRRTALLSATACITVPHVIFSSDSSNAALALEQAAAAQSPSSPPTPTRTSPPSSTAFANFIDREYKFRYPSNYLIIEDNIPTAPKSTNAKPNTSPLRAELRSPDNKTSITVINRQAATMKQALFQVTDISQLGTPMQVAQYILPQGSTVSSFSVITIPQASRDPKSPLGIIIERDPITIQRFSVNLPASKGGGRTELAVGARLGQVYVLGASAATDADWEVVGDDLKQIADSFQIIPKMY
jgi:hypothetical protein